MNSVENVVLNKYDMHFNEDIYNALHWDGQRSAIWPTS